jgi:haloacid dehalogenase superfamily, subfamily IA, variant 3 with third motif having DD or ED
MLNFTTIRAVLFDMDGVLYRGQTPLPGVADVFSFLAEHNIAFACITNNASMTPQQYEAKLAKMGIELAAQRVITSALATARYLRDHYPPGTRIFVVGMQGLREALFSDGYFVEDEQSPELVVQGADFTLTYERLKQATLHIRRGARFVSTNPDRTFPSEEGLIPGAGAIAAALSAATDVTPLVIGKPAPTMFLIGAALLGADPQQTLVVGDRLDTDIAGANAAGMPSVLVLTGVSTLAEASTGSIRPDLVVADLPELLTRWQESLKTM